MNEEYIYVAVDETGNLGKSLMGERYYTLVACVVNDRKRFEDATRNLGLSEELKFNTHESYRDKILRYAAPAISDVFYVCYLKNKSKSQNRLEQSELHLRMVHSLADSIVLRYGFANDLVVEIDHKDGISDRVVSELFSMNEYKLHRIYCKVIDSSISFGLQTNDFVAGAIGKMLNNSEFHYVRILNHEPRVSYIRSDNQKSGGDLLPLSGVQAHTNILSTTGMPPEFPMKSESECQQHRQSFPMVPYRRHCFHRFIKVTMRPKSANVGLFSSRRHRT